MIDLAPIRLMLNRIAPYMSVSDRCMICHTPCSAGGFDQAKRNCALQSESACDVESTLTAFDNPQLPF
jgi:hypothetical protein